MDIHGVFEVVREIPEIGARAGDRIVLRPSEEEYTCSLVRDLGPIASRCWAFTDSCVLEITDPPLPLSAALRALHEAAKSEQLHLWEPCLRLVD